MKDKELTIARMAEHIGLSVHTLRYYERIGLLDPIERAESGHRRYGVQDVAWIEFLNRLRATGMPIRLMQQYEEVIIQTVPYAGFPTAINAMNLLHTIDQERESSR